MYMYIVYSYETVFEFLILLRVKNVSEFVAVSSFKE